MHFHGAELAALWREVHHQFHLGIRFGDMSFSQVPLHFMERIAGHMEAVSFDPLDLPGFISNEIFVLIEEIDSQDMVVRVPHLDGYSPVLPPELGLRPHRLEQQAIYHRQPHVGFRPQLRLEFDPQWRRHR